MTRIHATTTDHADRTAFACQLLKAQPSVNALQASKDNSAKKVTNKKRMKILF
jgi:hypothetical protein